jgi:hypothetical protein
MGWASELGCCTFRTGPSADRTFKVIGVGHSGHAALRDVQVLQDAGPVGGRRSGSLRPAPSVSIV